MGWYAVARSQVGGTPRFRDILQHVLEKHKDAEILELGYGPYDIGVHSI